MPKHYLIFIHGIGQLKNQDASCLGYSQLWELLIQQSGKPRGVFEQQFGKIEVVWHVDQLQKAEQTLFDLAFPDLKPEMSTFKPAMASPMDRLREFMTFFIGDVSAYVSEDVNFIRRTVWDQIWSYQESGKSFQQLLEEGATYSIVAHSLGTVIAFDYLFHLFHPSRAELFVPCPDVDKRPEDEHLTDDKMDAAREASQQLPLLKNSFRHFFSMGSPIALFFMRKGSLWAEGEPFQTVYNPVREKGRIWCNFWDKNDPIAYPLERLFALNKEQNNECKLRDFPVKTWWIPSAHLDYWKNRAIAKQVVNCLNED